MPPQNLDIQSEIYCGLLTGTLAEPLFDFCLEEGLGVLHRTEVQPGFNAPKRVFQRRSTKSQLKGWTRQREPRLLGG